MEITCIDKGGNFPKFAPSFQIPMNTWGQLFKNRFSTG